MKKVKNILRVLILCMMLSIATGVYAQEVTNISTLEFTKLLKPLDTSNRLNINESSKALLTREKAAALIIKLMGYEGIAKDYKNSTLYKDVTAYKGEIHIVSQLGIMSGTGTGLFTPTKPVTYEQAKIITQRIQNKLNKPATWNHAFYAISSSSQMELIPTYDAVSFGWAQVGYDAAKQSFGIQTTQGDFKVPTGFYKPLDLAKSNGVETYLMVFFEDKNGMAKQLLNNETQVDKLIKQIVDLSNGITKDGVTRAFDGVTIDFENFISSDLAMPYTKFLSKLKTQLKLHNKKLNVAVPPTIHFKGYDYKGIGEYADKVILMAHDYSTKSLTPFEQEIGRIITPLTPINEVYASFAAITNSATGIQDKSKIVLQISYGALQWQTKEGKVINSKAYTPTYDKIYARLKNSSTQSLYDETYQNPYVVYEENGIRNIIWYENNKSVKAKTDLAKLFGIQGISYWRLGMIPFYEG
jgi:spore germination protein YaaH